MRRAVALSLGVLVTVILVRPAYISRPPGSTTCACAVPHRPAFDSLSARESAVVSFAGMRSVVTLAAAAAIPLTSNGAPFPERATLQLVAYSVAIGTLLLQGLTVPWVIRRLKVGSSDETASDAAQRPRSGWRPPTRSRADREQRSEWSRFLGPERADEMIGKLQRVARPRDRRRRDVIEPTCRRARARRGPAARCRARGNERARTVSPSGVPTPSEGKRTQKLQREIVSAQREVLMQWRDSGQLDEVVMRRVMRELDLEDESLSSSWLSRVRA